MDRRVKVLAQADQICRLFMTAPGVGYIAARPSSPPSTIQVASDWIFGSLKRASLISSCSPFQYGVSVMRSGTSSTASPLRKRAGGRIDFNQIGRFANHAQEAVASSLGHRGDEL
jgi:hypothetical protein